MLVINHLTTNAITLCRLPLDSQGNFLVVVDFRNVAQREHLLLILKVAVGGDAVVTTYLVLLDLWLHRFCILWSDRGECRGRAKAFIHIHHHLWRCE